ncbi:MAG: HAMP domain-containing histidine kinase [Nitrospira sp.]|nr:HAMP domain-containing histidine kinase [Nitrospira sp.]MDH4244898.1 HAMP domain-containing histidine kinase [Nitrospira sp.]MDH4357363.1 HAMP domain-containing histidine kinase [Nitrospira sp.]
MRANLSSLTPHRFSISLRAKLVCCTALSLAIACLLLAWMFVRQQVRSSAESSVQSGTLLAQHLAQMGRSSIVAGDIPRLHQHIHEILAVNPVAYVAVISPSGDLQAGFGKGAWQEQFAPQDPTHRRFAATKLVQLRHQGDMTNEPLVSAISLSNRGPILRETIDLAPGELLALAAGIELPIFYDITVHVPRYPLISEWDPALQLTLEERFDGLEEDTAHALIPPTVVQVGISTSLLQQSLRRLLWQAVIITLSTLVGGLAMAVLLARRITIPLRSLTVAATKLAEGDTVPSLVVRTRDEIGTLTGVFNHMAKILHAREQELRELAHSLEDRVTARTQELAAANIKLQELDRRKSVFVSTASHELRTPLTSMKVHVANMRDGIDGAITTDQRRSLGRVEANLSRLQVLIEQLLDLSQIEMGEATLQIEPVAVGSVIARTAEDLNALATERRVRIQISLAADLPQVLADPAKLQQILLNLLHNAVKFTYPNSTVEVSATLLPGGDVKISVADAGPGIMLEDVEKVFQPFYRVPTVCKQSNGTGLGLAITKLLVELHNGRLWVETVPGHGSRFSFTMRPIPATQSTIVRAVSHRIPHQPTVQR